MCPEPHRPDTGIVQPSRFAYNNVLDTWTRTATTGTVDPGGAGDL